MLSRLAIRNSVRRRSCGTASAFPCAFRALPAADGEVPSWTRSSTVAKTVASSSDRWYVTGKGGASKAFFSAEAYEDEDAIAEGIVADTTTATTSNIGNNKKRAAMDLTDLPINFADISRAEVAIRGGVKRTSCEKSPFISELVGANVYLKTEFRQFTGSFKERGARNAILQLMRELKTELRGVIAASAGNHALALAYHGKELGVPVTVVMPTVAPLAKVDKCRVRDCDVRAE
jgi:Pyridoxal-phosphate dependent enzyme